MGLGSSLRLAAAEAAAWRGYPAARVLVSAVAGRLESQAASAVTSSSDRRRGDELHAIRGLAVRVP